MTLSDSGCEQLHSLTRSFLKIGGAISMAYGVLSTSDITCASQVFEHLTTQQNISLFAGLASSVSGLYLSWRSHAK